MGSRPQHARLAGADHRVRWRTRRVDPDAHELLTADDRAPLRVAPQREAV